jgi:hypothetical protein
MPEKEIVCGICGYDISDTDAPCPYCGATPDHFVEKSKVDAELLKKIYKDGGATY